MRSIRLLLVPLVFAACTDVDPAAPDVEVSPLFAKTADMQDGGVKMVPYRATGTWKLTGFDWVSGCGGHADWIAAFLEIDGTGTHTGRFHTAITNCFDGVTFEFETQTGTTTAANGDQIYYRGSREDYGTTHPFYPDNTWEMGPLHLVGGTGRFANAEGVFSAWGTNNDAITEGTAAFEGWISSVGSSR